MFFGSVLEHNLTSGDNISRLPGQGDLLLPVTLGTRVVDCLDEGLGRVAVLYLSTKGVVICMTVGLIPISTPK